MTKRAIRSGCHRTPLSAFSFSRQADSLTRLRDSRAVFRRVLRPLSSSPTAFWKHGEALRHVRHKRNPLGEHNPSELDPLSTIRNIFRTFQSWRKIGTSESRDGSLLRSETETARPNPRIPLTPRICKTFAGGKMTVGDAGRFE